MARLIYGANLSLDGYIEDRDGKFDWTEPDDDVHLFINDLYRPVGTFLFGRRMYETMAVWETDPELTAASDITADFAGIWQGADKIVYSSTLQSPSTSRTRVESRFDADAVRALKSSASRDLAIGGPDVAGHAFGAGLVDDLYLFFMPVVVGGGKPGLPDRRLDLELVDHRRFPGGTFFARYRVRT